MTDLPILNNKDARRLFLARHALSSETSGSPDLLDLITRLGFVQVDSINTVERAHHMILAARSRRYRPKHLKKLQEKDRKLFEHWTHDAAVIPVDFFPYWQLRFRRDAVKLRARYKDWHRAGFEEKFDAVLSRIREHGPCGSRDVGEDEARGTGGWWDWHPSKTALEYLWRAGKLSVTRRDGFQKVYDLTERVIPEAIRAADRPEPEIIDWACDAALDRLGFATPGEIARFWDKITPDEAKDWCADRNSLIQIGIQGADGSIRPSYARPDVFKAAADAPEAPTGLRILSPFDPALRDRNRAERLFGFHYRIEIFVPEPRRTYGYYVFPVLERDRLTGRIDMKRDPGTGALTVRAFWPEAGVKLGAGRLDRLDAELHRMARFSGCDCVTYLDGWQRETL